MPRNGSGTYTLPSGNPVVSGTVIESTWANSTLADLADAITNSLARNGEGGMTAPLRLTDGVVATPSLAFANETGSGLYRAAAGDLGLSVLGSRILRLQAAGASVTGTLGVTGATTLSSTLGVTGNLSVNTNKFTVAATTGNTVVAGTLDVTGQITGDLTGEVTGNASTATTLATARTINGTSFNGSANITTTNWGTARTLWGQSVNGSANITAPLQPAAGSVTAPAFSTSGDTNTGIYFPSADTLAITTGGTQALTINAKGDMSVIGRLRSSGNQSATAWTTTGQGFDIAAATFTDTSTAAAGTVASRVIGSFNTPTLASTNAITVTNAATVYIAGAPVAGTNTTITNDYALWVDSGDVQMDGNVVVSGILSVRSAIDLADSDILRFGSGDDWELFHDGTSNYMDLNVGNLIVRDGTTTRFTFERTTGILVTTGAVEAAAGTVSAPSFSTSGDTNTGMFFPAADTIAFAEGGVEAMRITSAGNVGIGTDVPGSKLDIRGTGTQTLSVRAETSGDAVVYLEASGTNAGEVGYSRSGQALYFKNNGSERARIDSNGNLLSKWTALDSWGADGVAVRGPIGRIDIGTSTTASASKMYFANPNGVVGQIYTSGSSTSYATSSDYRLKENVAPMTGALAKVAALNPVTYTWKADGSSGQGFIAHELQAVVPDCVSGEKDAVRIVDVLDDEGNVIGTKEEPQYQGVDTSFLVATLVAAIQELNAKVEALETVSAT